MPKSTPLLGYQWCKGGIPLNNGGSLLGAQTPVLTVSNLLVADAGACSAVVTNSWGSVTSLVAVLTVQVPPTPPLILSNDGAFGLRSNRFGFNLRAVPGQVVVIEASTNLMNWTPLATNTLGVAPLSFSDPGSTNHPGRFYRARLPY